MRFSNGLLLTGVVALLGSTCLLDAQLTPEQLRQAQEILRQSQPQTPAVPAPPASLKTNAAPAVTAPSQGGMTNGQQQQALDLLRTIPTTAPSGSPQTTKEQQKALEVLRAVQTPTPAEGQPAADKSPPLSDEQRQTAIRQAVEEAQRIAEQRQKERQQNVQAGNQTELHREISQVQTEILKAKEGAKGTTPTPPAAQSATTAVSPGASASRQTPPMTTAEEKAARALLEQTSATTSTQTKAEVKRIQKAPPAADKIPAVADRSPTPAAVVIPPPGAPNPLPQSKQNRLADLFEAYRSEKISAAEYHQTRAKILAEP
jgi:hypothetical protein